MLAELHKEPNPERSDGIFTQEWLNSKMGMRAAPPNIHRIAYVVTAAPANVEGAASGKLKFAQQSGGTGVAPPEMQPDLDFGGGAQAGGLAEEFEGEDEGRQDAVESGEGAAEEEEGY